MDMRDGMLGVVIIAIALAVALFGSYLAGVTPQEESVIKYNYLADVSGEFKYDQSPQYIDFDPSTNYTGYYSNDTYSESANKYYFAEDQVEYTPNVDSQSKNIVNNYRVDLMPTEYNQTSTDLTEVDVDESGEKYTVAYVKEKDEEYKSWIHYNPPMSLTDLISTMRSAQYSIIPTDATTLRITTGDIDWEGNESKYWDGLVQKDLLELDAVLIIPDSWFTPWTPLLGHIVFIVDPNNDITKLDSSQLQNADPHYPYRSFEIDLTTGFAIAYMNADFTNPDRTYATDHLWVCYGETQQGISRELDLADNLINQSFTEKISYLNPRDGVSLKDEEETS